MFYLRDVKNMELKHKKIETNIILLEWKFNKMELKYEEQMNDKNKILLYEYNSKRNKKIL